MEAFVLSSTTEAVGVLTLNRPAVMNAWHRPMRIQLIRELKRNPMLRESLLA